MTDIRVTPRPWLCTPRTHAIRLIEIHATRGANTPDAQFGATANWMQSPNNVGERDASGRPLWGGSCSYILGRVGELGTVLEDNQQPTFSAGFGGEGSTFAIDQYGISYEWCQSQAQEPFTPQQYQRGAREIAAKCHKYGIPPIMIEVPIQQGAVPTGIVRHDRCQNGYVLGKTDPGKQFDEKLFIGLVQMELAKLQSPAPEEEDEMEIGALAAYMYDIQKKLNAKAALTPEQQVFYQRFKGLFALALSDTLKAPSKGQRDGLSAAVGHPHPAAPATGGGVTLDQVRDEIDAATVKARHE